ncbi:MAG: transcriptional regulator [Firmicutes bacterium]|nr:transcriptional regulator [Bacillota bacterium]
MTPNMENIIFICVIVNRNVGSRVLHAARKYGLSGGTILLGRGTIKNPLLEALALNDVKKEIVFLVAEESVGLKFLENLSKELKLQKQNHGIAFVRDVARVCGTKCLSCSGLQDIGDEENAMYQSVYIIVDRGKGETAVEAATKAGAKGATIISARGSGIHETSRLFNMEIEPEKEIVLIILKSEIAEKVVSAVRTEMDIDKPGNGIIFVQNVRQVYGLFE